MATTTKTTEQSAGSFGPSTKDLPPFRTRTQPSRDGSNDEQNCSNQFFVDVSCPSGKFSGKSKNRIAQTISYLIDEGEQIVIIFCLSFFYSSVSIYLLKMYVESIDCYEIVAVVTVGREQFDLNHY